MCRHSPLFAHMSASVRLEMSLDREMCNTPGSKGGTGKGGAGPSSKGSSESRSNMPDVEAGKEADSCLQAHVNDEIYSSLHASKFMSIAFLAKRRSRALCAMHIHKDMHVIACVLIGAATRC